MDDLLLFTPTKNSHIAKIEELIKALLKNGLRYLHRNISSSENNYNICNL